MFAVAATIAARPAAAQSCVPGFDYGAFGKTSVDFGGNSSVDSFNSAAGTYAATQSSSGGNLGTNGTGSGAITVHGTASSVYGDLYYGVGGTASSVTIHGHPTVGDSAALTTNLALPSVIVPSLGANLGVQVGGTLSPGNTYTAVSGSVSIGAGTYVIGALTASLTVTSGPVIIYVTTAFGADVTNHVPSSPGTPGNLIFMIGPNVASVGLPEGSYAMYAPDTDLAIHGNNDIYGAIVGASITITGTPNLHYDRALATTVVGSFDCALPEVSRASPVVATINNQTAIVQGTFTPAASAATAITDIASVAAFRFPAIAGHMRARATSSITTAGSKFSSGTILFDAAEIGLIPGVNYAGCSSMNGTCRNVFTVTSAPEAGGVQFHPPAVQLNDGNASAIGALIAPASIVSGIGAAQWQTIVRTVLGGALGGVDRSTVAVIGASVFAGSAARPTIAYFGAADGMLHAVCASTGSSSAGSASTPCPRLGTELWAFLPRVQLPLIRTNTARVDGSPRVVDVFGDFTGNPATGARSWHTILTFQTGFAVNASPAAYAIDVTDPASPVVLWEYTPPRTPGALDFGAGLTVTAGPTLINAQLGNLAILQTANGGTGGAGVVATALSQETGAKIWQFGYAYPSPPRGVAADTVLLPTTGIVGGPVRRPVAAQRRRRHQPQRHRHAAVRVLDQQAPDRRRAGDLQDRGPAIRRRRLRRLRRSDRDVVDDERAVPDRGPAERDRRRDRRDHDRLHRLRPRDQRRARRRRQGILAGARHRQPGVRDRGFDRRQPRRLWLGQQHRTRPVRQPDRHTRGDHRRGQRRRELARQHGDLALQLVEHPAAAAVDRGDHHRRIFGRLHRHAEAHADAVAIDDVADTGRWRSAAVAGSA
ncbi:MAG: hypothetical protein E6J90_25230 [Deltaproteobacteria bacterium]|nr:MAG: hypothetical protein E6J90_25230 [Deltaproteobacteria bacterium]